MPRSLNVKTGLSTIAGLFVVCALIAAWARFDRHRESHKLNMSSRMPLERLMGKHLAPINVQIVAPEAIPAHEFQELKLTGYITMSHEINSTLKYEWNLPEGVQIVSGDQHGSLAEMAVGESLKLEIIVRGFCSENLKHIVLNGSVNNGESELSHSALISSRPEDSMEYVAKEIRDYAVESRPEEFPRGRLIK